MKRQTSGEQGIVHHADGVEVGPTARGDPSKSSGAMNVGVPATGTPAGSSSLEVADQAEVGELGMSRGGEQDVGGLDVAMDQPRLVRGAQGQDDLADEGRGPDRVERSFLASDSLRLIPPGTYSISM